MNCDQVFDELTRGPFPTGRVTDASVERHLARCSACRRLAIALRPAVELFEEAIRPEDSHGLPSYWGEAAEPYSAPRDATFATLEEEISLARRTRRRWTAAQRARGVIPVRAWEDCDRLLRFCGAMAVGVLLALACRSALDNRRSSGALAEGDGAVGAGLPWRVCSPAWLAPPEQPLQGSTIRAAGVVRLARLASERHRCCSECHHAGGGASAPHALAYGVADSCAVCHDETEPDEHEALLGSPLSRIHSEPGV